MHYRSPPIVRRNLNLTPEKTLAFSATSGDGMRWACHARELLSKCHDASKHNRVREAIVTQNNFELYPALQ
jgi:hypothetical protein